jgi:endonuclease YncB( thermonuclease family)
MRLTTDHLFWTISLALLGAAIFFTVSITSFKKELNLSGKILEIRSGQEAMAVKIIDGDEISVMINSQQVVVRILGIFSFDPTVNDPLYQNIGKSSYTFLKNTVLNKNVTLVFQEFKKDSNNRILAYVHMGKADVGKEMLSKGLTLVYIKYPFYRLNEYLETEKIAKQSKTGLWGDPNVAKRSIQLKNQWRINGEGE